jgi:hypothetical protein
VAKKNLKAMNDYLEPLMPRIEAVLGLAGTGAVAAGGYLASTIGHKLRGVNVQDYAAGAVSDAAPTVLNHLATSGLVLLNLLQPLGAAFSAVTNAVVGTVAAALPGLSAVLDMVVGVGGFFATAFLNSLTILANAIGPMLTTIMTAWSQVVSVAMDVYIIAYSKVKPAIDAAVDAIRRFTHHLQEAFEWIQQKLHFGKGAQFGPEAPGGIIDRLAGQAQEARRQLGFGSVNASGGISDWLRRQEQAQAAAAAKQAADLARIAKEASKNKRPLLNQDFRGSKFSIEQKFAQGFDPGRVLTAVREDSAKLAQRRLSAGNTPLFGGG